MKTMNSGLRLGVGLAALLAVAACGGSSAGTGSSAANGATAPKATPAQAAPALEEAELSTLDEIPSTEALEQQLTTTVTDDNADAEFEKLQKELDAEEGG